MSIKILASLLIAVFLFNFGIALALRNLNHQGALNKGLLWKSFSEKKIRHLNDFERLEKQASLDPKEQWFTQQSDHFNPLNRDTFQQRYFVNTQYWKGDGSPIFSKQNSSNYKKTTTPLNRRKIGISPS